MKNKTQQARNMYVHSTAAKERHTFWSM